MATERNTDEVAEAPPSLDGSSSKKRKAACVEAAACPRDEGPRLQIKPGALNRDAKEYDWHYVYKVTGTGPGQKREPIRKFKKRVDAEAFRDQWAPLGEAAECSEPAKEPARKPSVASICDEGVAFDGVGVAESDGEDEELLMTIPKTLAERFGAPPVSILRADLKYWTTRRDQWEATGIGGVQGRQLTGPGNHSQLAGKGKGGYVSDFDPLTAELMIRWYCKKGGAVIDPFTGGAVRGLVAERMGSPYVGIDIRRKQVQSNKAVAAEMHEMVGPPEGQAAQWILGDSEDIVRLVQAQPTAESNGAFDMLLTCPPYGPVERYSDLQQDLSNMKVEQMLKKYSTIILESCKLLAAQAFACVVVANFRDKRGFLVDLAGATTDAFQKAGLGLWQKFTYSPKYGCASLRADANRTFSDYGKAAQVTSEILIYLKGEPKLIPRMGRDPERAITLPVIFEDGAPAKEWRKTCASDWGWQQQGRQQRRQQQTKEKR